MGTELLADRPVSDVIGARQFENVDDEVVVFNDGEIGVGCNCISPDESRWLYERLRSVFEPMAIQTPSVPLKAMRRL